MKSKTLQQNVISFCVGLIFAIGLALSGMTQPQKVIGFLSLSHWDPSLLFVMVGAIMVHSLSYLLIRKRPTPLLETQWHIPTRNDLTTRLILGSAIFGVGWGLGGYCPGPGLTSLVAGDERTFVFVISMIIGMLLFKFTEPFLKMRK